LWIVSRPTRAASHSRCCSSHVGEGDYLHWLCPLAWLPPDTREGSWLRVEFTPDPETQAEVGSEIESLLRELQEE
jgi:hypothetical protein